MSECLLLVDTAAPQGVVAIAVDGEIAAEERLVEPRRHAEQLAGAIESVLSSSKVKRDDLHAVVVGHGPGSFIGVRVALSAAKGFAFGLQIPLWGIGTLHGFGSDPSLPLGHGWAALDARRGELYLARCVRHAEGEIIRTEVGEPRTGAPAMLISTGEDEGEDEEKTSFVVGHLGSTGEDLVSTLGPTLFARSGPSASGLLAALTDHSRANEISSLVPAYCRDPDAKLPTPRVPGGSKAPG